MKSPRKWHTDLGPSPRSLAKSIKVNRSLAAFGGYVTWTIEGIFKRKRRATQQPHLFITIRRRRVNEHRTA